MPRTLLPSLTYAVAFLLVGAAHLRAQSLPLVVGDRVRVNAPQLGASPAIGTVADLHPGQLVLHREHDETVALPVATIRRLEASRGRHSHMLSGAVIGAVGGAGVGAIIGGTSKDTGPGALGRGALIAVGAGLGSAGGVVIGAVVGALIRTERWRDVPLTTLTFHGSDIATPTLAARRSAAGFGVPVAWLGR